MSEAPSTNGSNGRGDGGRFAPGNAGGPGNPHARRVARLRTAMLKAVTTDDMRAIVAKLIEEAKAGNVQAAKEVLERTLGAPKAEDFLERIERLEAMMGTLNQGAPNGR